MTTRRSTRAAPLATPLPAPPAAETPYQIHKREINETFNGLLSSRVVKWANRFLHRQFDLPLTTPTPPAPPVPVFHPAMLSHPSITDPYALLSIGDFDVVTLSFSMFKSKKGRTDWTLVGIERCFVGQHRRLWLGDLERSLTGHDILTLPEERAPIISILKSALARLSTMEGGLKKSFDQTISRVVQEYASSAALHTYTAVPVSLEKLQAGAIDKIRLTSSVAQDFLIPVADARCPLRPDILPESPRNEPSGVRPSIKVEASNAARLLGWSMETTQQFESTVAWMLSDGPAKWAPNVNKYFLTPEQHLFMKCPDRLFISTSMHIWGRFGNRSSPTQTSFQTTPGLDMEQLAAIGNDIFAQTDDPHLAIQSVALHVHGLAPESFLRSGLSHKCYRQIIQAGGIGCDVGQHTCAHCGALKSCKLMIVTSSNCFCPQCVLLHYRLPLIQAKTPMQSSLSRASRTPGSAQDLDRSPHMQPLAEVQWVELCVDLDALDSVEAVDDQVMDLVNRAGYKLHRSPQTRRIQYSPKRLYLINTLNRRSRTTSQPLDIVWPAGLVVKQRWVDEYRDFYSASGATLLDTGLEPRTLQPSAERVRLKDEQGNPGHTVMNTRVTAAGINIAKGPAHPAVPAILAALRVLCVCRHVFCTADDDLRTREYQMLVERLGILIDALSALLRCIPYNTPDRLALLTSVANDAYNSAYPLLMATGLNLPPDIMGRPLSTTTSTSSRPPSPSLRPPSPSLRPPSPSSGPSPAVNLITAKSSLQTRKVYQKVRASVAAAARDPAFRDQWATAGFEIHEDTTGYDDSENDNEKVDQNDDDDEEEIDEEELHRFCSVDVEMLRHHLPDLAIMAKEAMHDPSSRFFAPTRWSEKWLTQIQDEGHLILPWGDTLQQQAEDKLLLMERMALICDKETGWHIVVTLESFVVQNLFFRLITQDRCHLFGIRLRPNICGTSERSAELTRNPLHWSEGHIIHGQPMSHASISSKWRSLRQDGLDGFDFERANVMPESWLANLYRYNWSLPDLEALDSYVLADGLLRLDEMFAKIPTLDAFWRSGGREQCSTHLESYKMTEELRYLELPPSFVS